MSDSIKIETGSARNVKTSGLHLPSPDDLTIGKLKYLWHVDLGEEESQTVETVCSVDESGRVEIEASYIHLPEAGDLTSSGGVEYFKRALADSLAVPPETLGLSARNYGGWSDGDVLSELSRIGEASPRGRAGGSWKVHKGQHFRVNFGYCDEDKDKPWYTSQFNVDKYELEKFATLQEAIQYGVERWREIVAASDPMPPQEAPAKRTEPVTRHIGTGDMGIRSTLRRPYRASGLT